MTGGLENAGDAVTAGLVARAVEPTAGEAGHEPREACLNCGTELIGRHCHNCGQAGHVHRSIAAIGHDIAHGVFHFEGKIWRTLPMLAFRPGELTRRYVQGERARFVSPLALFLFTVFLMFAVINTFGGHLETDTIDPAKIPQLRAETERQVAIQRRGVEITEQKIANARAQGTDASKLQEDLRTRREILRELEGAQREMAGGDAPASAKVQTGWAKLDKGLAKMNANPNLALYKIQSSAYKFSWALIPISVPFVWLMFAWHRRRHLYDHAIFVTYSLSFMSLLVIVLTAIGLMGAPNWIIVPAAVLIPPLHMYRQLKGAYELGRWGAIVRSLLLLVFSAAALLMFLLFLLGLGLMS
jgi:hypothetical protein